LNLKEKDILKLLIILKIPFIVKAGEIQVKALGTVFNIMAYPDEDRIETSLINGR
jgi:transmembrane sensor